MLSLGTAVTSPSHRVTMLREGEQMTEPYREFVNVVEYLNLAAKPVVVLQALGHFGEQASARPRHLKHPRLDLSRYMQALRW